MNRAAILLGPDKGIEAKAKSLGLEVVIADEVPLPVLYDQVLIVEPGTHVPWDLLNAGWHFLQRWDVAAPLWRYGVLCEDIGTDADRRATKAKALDLRVPVYAAELVFANGRGDGGAFVATWVQECQGGRDRRLAFTRALSGVKPRFCALPRSWLGKVTKRKQRDVRSRRSMAGAAGAKLVRVEISPGRFVKCKPGDEERVREEWQRRLTARRERMARAGQ